MGNNAVLYLVCSVALFLAMADMPSGYFTFLRILVTVGSAFRCLDDLASGRSSWFWIFGCMAILFNPIIPVYLHDKESWFLFDLIGGILFLVSYFQFKSAEANGSNF